MRDCQKFGSYLKRLDLHLKRCHPTLSEKMHRYLPVPPIMSGIPNHMKYRKKETCKLCGKTLLLLPHLKRCHKICSREDYNKQPCATKKISGNQQVVKEKTYTVPTLPQPHTDQEYWYLKRKKNGLFEAWENLKAKTPVPKTKQTTNKEGLHSGDDKLVKLWSLAAMRQPTKKKKCTL